LTIDRTDPEGDNRMTTQIDAPAQAMLGWFGAGGPEKEPLKENVFASMVTHQGMQQQRELFPYFGPSDLVPAGAFSYSLPDMPRFHFYHYNEQQEIVISMASEGAPLKTGHIHVQDNTHGVTTFLTKPNAPRMEAYQICLITIRMRPFAPQNEAKLFRCSECNELIHRYDEDIHVGPPRRFYQELPNIRVYADAVDKYNATDRVCPACGHQNEPFPQDIAGWRRYADYIELANRARGDIEKAAIAEGFDGEVAQ
jgi:hypothetical protein